MIREILLILSAILLTGSCATAVSVSLSMSSGGESYYEHIDMGGIDEFELTTEISPDGIWSFGDLEMTTGTFNFESTRDAKTIKSKNVKTTARISNSVVSDISAGGLDITPHKHGPIGELNKVMFVGDAYAWAVAWPIDFNTPIRGGMG